jgi:glucose/arabinose dehydrogenase
MEPCPRPRFDVERGAFAAWGRPSSKMKVHNDPTVMLRGGISRIVFECVSAVYRARQRPNAVAREATVSSTPDFRVVRVAGPFEDPWSIAFLPEGGMLVTERPGRLQHVHADGTAPSRIGARLRSLPAV